MKKILFVVIVAILLIIINNLARSIYDIWQKKDFVTKAEQELSFQKQENQRLKSALSYSKTQEFKEKEARYKLFKNKEGKPKVVNPEEMEKPRGEEKNTDPNWK